MVAWLGPMLPAGGKPKVTAVIKGTRRAIGAATQRAAQIVGEAAHVHSPTGTDLEASGRRRRIVCHQANRVNLDQPRPRFDDLAAASLPVQRLTALLESRVDGRHLCNTARE